MIPLSICTRHGYVEVRKRFDPRTITDHWFRAEDCRYANYDPWAEFEQPSGSHLVLEISAFPVEKYTRRGVWLIVHGTRRFVAGSSIKQFAVPTVALAVADLIARKQRHFLGVKARLDRTEEHLSAALNLQAELERARGDRD